MIRDHLGIYHEYSQSHRFFTRTASPSSGMSIVSDRSGVESLDSQAVVVDDRLRTLILVTGIWVAFREGWSHHLTCHDPVAKSHVKVPESMVESRSRSSKTTINEDNTVVPEGGVVSQNPRRWMPVALRVRHFNVTSSRWFKSCNSLVGRSSSARTI